MNNHKTPAPAPASQDEGNLTTLFGWSSGGGDRSRRLFPTKESAQRAAVNHAKRHGGSVPKLVHVPSSAELAEEAERHGNAPRPEVG